MNRKSNPRELKMKEDLELLSQAVIKQHDAIVVLTRENELLKSDKFELLDRLQNSTRNIAELKNDVLDMQERNQNLEDFKDRVIPMLETYFALV